MAFTPITQLMMQAQQGVNLRQEEERKQAAYNALSRIYGPMAGDPQAALQMQDYGHNEQANPLRIDAMRQDNALSQQTYDFNEQANPLQIEGAHLANEGVRTGNMDESTKLRRKALVDGALYVKKRIGEGVDAGSAFDEAAPYLPVTDEQKGQLRETLTSDPAALDAFLSEFGTDGNFETGLQIQYGQDAEGNVVPMQATKSGQIIRSQMPPGVTLQKEPIKVDMGAQGTALLDPTTRQLIGVVPTTNLSPDQRVITDDQGNVVGAEAISGSKLDVERQEKGDRRAEGQTKLTENLEGLAHTYLRLNEMGAAVSPDRGIVGNVIARLRSTSVGQIAESGVGTEAQSLRERVNNMRPLLVQHIRQATEMSARGMDSNRELEFYLQAATDPAKDIYSNLAAIQVLDETFGLGGVLERTLPPDIFERIATQARIDRQTMPIVVTPDQLEGGAGDLQGLSEEELDAEYERLFGGQ